MDDELSLAPLIVDQGQFKDRHGRTAILRGVNLGGESKVPFPDGGTHQPTDFSDHRRVSFIGRPFPFSEADEHFGRIRRWGFNCLRLLTTWEAVEHAGPGIYDEAYLDYFAQVCERAGRHGLYVIIDFHQDVWSRMSGGDGAPGWTLEAAGLDPTRLDESDAAFTMQKRMDFHDPRPCQPERYPLMSWVTNYARAANGIMWTLFFGGRDFAPDFRVDGVSIQDYLQSHFIRSQAVVARRMRHMPHVIGFDLLNEPHRGWIGRPLSRRPTDPKEGDVMPGVAWSPLDALLAAGGITLELPVMGISLRRRGLAVTGKRVVNPKAISAWLPGRQDPFRVAGAYTVDPNGGPRVLRDDHFQRIGNRPVDFVDDYLKPFHRRAAQALHSINPDWLIFLEPDLLNADPARCFTGDLPPNSVNAGHWYDATTLLLKRFLHPVGFNLLDGRVLLGRRQRLHDYQRQLSTVARQSANLPVFVGEFGIPYDMNGARAYRRDPSGRSRRYWRRQRMALNLMYESMEALGLSCCQWNYTASNRNDLRIGDGWNQEDLSIFSRDQCLDPTDPDDGGRAVDAFARPLPRAVQGRLLKWSFDAGRGRLMIRWLPDVSVDRPTEVVLAAPAYRNGVLVTADGCRWEIEADVLCLWAERHTEVGVLVVPGAAHSS